MNDFEGHGWAVVSCPHPPAHGAAAVNHIRRDDKAALHIGQLPGRKQLCLYGHNGNPSVIHVFAYFVNEEKAAEALAIIDRLVKP